MKKKQSWKLSLFFNDKIYYWDQSLFFTKNGIIGTSAMVDRRWSGGRVQVRAWEPIAAGHRTHPSLEQGTQTGAPKMGVPQNGWFTMEHAIKTDDLGVPPFQETSTHSILPKNYNMDWNRGMLGSQILHERNAFINTFFGEGSFLAGKTFVASASPFVPQIVLSLYSLANWERIKQSLTFQLPPR